MSLPVYLSRYYNTITEYYYKKCYMGQQGSHGCLLQLY